MIISPIIMYMIFLLNSSISVIKYKIQANSLICVFYSWHVHIVLFFLLLLVSLMIIRDTRSNKKNRNQFQQYIIMHSIMHPGLYCR